MKHLKTYNQINELHSDTYYSAARNRLKSGDTIKARALLDHAITIDPALNHYLEAALWFDDPIEYFVQHAQYNS